MSLADLSEQLKKANEENNQIMLMLLKRFLDDLFLILQGTTKQIHKLLEEFNKIHKEFTAMKKSDDNELKRAEIKELMIQKPIAINNEGFLGGRHRVAAMIGRIIKGEAYIPFYVYKEGAR